MQVFFSFSFLRRWTRSTIGILESSSGGQMLDPIDVDLTDIDLTDIDPTDVDPTDIDPTDVDPIATIIMRPL